MKKTIIATIAILLATGTFADEYFLKESAGGSHIPHKYVVSGVPLTDSYQEVEQRHKDIIRNQYGGMDETVEPPFPKEGLRKLVKAIVEAHKYVGVPGQFVGIAVIDKKGKVHKLSVLKSPADGITQFVHNLLDVTEFSPGLCDGKVCNSEFLLEFELTLELDPSGRNPNGYRQKPNERTKTTHKVSLQIYPDVQSE